MNHKKLDKQARKILRENDRGGYTVPTRRLYPYQWNWDSGFAAWGFAAFDVKRAWFEIQTLFHGQWDNGMVPHIIFHKRADGYFPGPDVWGTPRIPHTSGITQPPVVTTFARSIYEADKEYGRVHMELLYGRLVSWHRWFMKHRVTDGMVAITHPWESGRDNAVDWDGAMANVDGSNVGPYERADTHHVNPEMRPKKEDYDRYLAMVQFSRDSGYDEAEIARNGPFRVADVGMTFILLRSCRDLLAIAAELDHITQEIRGWIHTLEQGVSRHWNENGGFYDSIDLRTGEHAGSLSSASFLCWYAGMRDDRMLPHLKRILDNVSFAVPSCDPESAAFNSLRYWRGPVWGIINTLIGLGLAEAGHIEFAERIRRDTRKLIAEHGFYEYFCPHDGAPAGGDAFTWTAAIWLTWASPSAKGRL
ncbi:MGH1-like glycoside hydrolase domain-containing protein [Aliiroseovarius sp. PTFE2010]|uniref:MGH1-like glycoside hydrolase domain-containing protein n=1 Tax=Aliiroseovarius sp. PTFE2010 TaxID=3417190 RepID=UPI003CF4AAAF